MRPLRAVLLQGHGRRGAQFAGLEVRRLELKGQRHGEAARVRGGDQLLGIGPIPPLRSGGGGGAGLAGPGGGGGASRRSRGRTRVLEPRLERIGRGVEHAPGRRQLAAPVPPRAPPTFAIPEAAKPLSGPPQPSGSSIAPFRTPLPCGKRPALRQAAERGGPTPAAVPAPSRPAPPPPSRARLRPMGDGSPAPALQTVADRAPPPPQPVQPLIVKGGPPTTSAAAISPASTIIRPASKGRIAPGAGLA